MKTYLLAAAAIAAIASPAAANGPYVGVEGGVLFPQDTDVDIILGDEELPDALRIDYKLGIDADIIAGYDFGMIRAEAELGWKRTSVDSVIIEGDVIDDFDEDHVSVLSAMGNLLLDFGAADRIGFYAGGGFGRARVKFVDDRDSAWAWQIIAGARMAVSSNVELGLKYRYFNTGRLHFVDEAEDFGARAKFRSHSVLASLIFNFGGAAAAPPPPPPPPPPPAEVAPATQTCADGSVILATDMCPLPPAPPPPPPPAPERG